MPNDHRAQPKYDSLRADDHDDLDAEIGETVDLDLEEKDYISQPMRSRPQRALAAISRYRWLLDVFLIIIIIGLLVDRQWVRQLDHDATGSSKNAGSTKGAGSSKETLFQGNGDVTGFAPRCE
jgi:hypothetical protein